MQRVAPAYVDPFDPSVNTIERFRTVDARASTDPSRGTLSYAWDLDGDGVYDDGSAGEAVVPVERFVVNGATVSPTVGVRVTSSNGQSSTGTITIEATGTPLFGQERDDVVLTPTTPQFDQDVTVAVTTAGGERTACVDADNDGLYEQTINTSGGRGQATISADGPGGHVVLVAFTGPMQNCQTANLGPDNDFIRFRAVYVTKAPTLGVGGLRVSTKSKSRVVVTSTATVSMPGKITQRITNPGATTALCTATRTVNSAGPSSLTCTMSSKQRQLLSKKSRRYTVITVFTPTVGPIVTATRNLKVKRAK